MWSWLRKVKMSCSVCHTVSCQHCSRSFPVYHKPSPVPTTPKQLTLLSNSQQLTAKSEPATLNSAQPKNPPVYNNWPNKRFHFAWATCWKTRGCVYSWKPSLRIAFLCDIYNALWFCKQKILIYEYILFTVFIMRITIYVNLCVTDCK